MPYAVVRVTRELLDEMIQERLRPEAQPDWTYELVVEIDEGAILTEKPGAPTMHARPSSRTARDIASGIPLATAIQTMGPP